jgi:hypothetical protein
MSIPHIPLDLWYDIFLLLDIDEAIAISKANPRLFGAFIESKQGIRFRNAINSYMRSNSVDLPVGHLSSFICCVSRNSSLDGSQLPTTMMAFPLRIVVLPTLMDLLSLSKMMEDVERYSIEKNKEREYGMIVVRVLGLGVGVVFQISISRTIVTRTSLLTADWVGRMEEIPD